MSVPTTPVPNRVFDEYLKELKIAEVKVLLVIIRQTLGWRKGSDWISSSQLVAKTGCSQRAIVSAVQTLTEKNIISVMGENGKVLNTPEERKGKRQLFYALSACLLNPVQSFEKDRGKELEKQSTCANIASDLRKNINALAQNMRITNYISTN